MPTVPLAELHSHLWGTTTADDYLDFMLSSVGPRDWGAYEDHYEEVYGIRPGMEEIVVRVGAGDRSARREFRDLYVFGEGDAGNFPRFQAKMNVLSSGRTTSQQGLDAEIHFARKAMETQARQGVRYAEQRNLFHKHGSNEAMRAIDGILRTFDGASGGLETRLAVSLDRADPWRLWEVVQNAALGPLGHLLTGVDFCFFEEGYPPSKKREFFAAVHDFNQRHPERALAILYHVGESFEDKSLESAVRWVHEAADMGAHRLGHAISLGIDPGVYGAHRRTEPVSERIDQLQYDLSNADGLARHGVELDRPSLLSDLQALRTLPEDHIVTHEYDGERLEQVRRRQDHAMERIKALNAVIEVCPTSNRRIGGITDPSQHPVLRFMENGVPFVISSDDAGIFDVTLEQEIDWVIEAADLGKGAFEEIASRSWRYRSEVLTGREAG